MKTTLSVVAIASLLAITGCANRSGPTGDSTAASTPTPSSPNGRIVKSRDGRFDGEIVGTPAPGSKFAKLQIGMEMNEVSKLIGGPDDLQRHETGKRWIPFYFGNDSQRMQASYRGEGCLTYTGGNVWGGGGNELIKITVDKSGVCGE